MADYKLGINFVVLATISSFTQLIADIWEHDGIPKKKSEGEANTNGQTSFKLIWKDNECEL